MGQAAVPSRFLLEIPAELMVGPRLGGLDEPDGDLNLDLVFGARRTSRFGTPVRNGAGCFKQAPHKRRRFPRVEPLQWQDAKSRRRRKQPHHILDRVAGLTRSTSILRPESAHHEHA